MIFHTDTYTLLPSITTGAKDNTICDVTLIQSADDSLTFLNVTLNAGQSYKQEVLSNQYMDIKCNRPALVAQYSKSGKSNRVSQCRW